MPALVKSNVGSFAGSSGLERARVWPCRSKYSRNFSRISLPVIVSGQSSVVSGQRPVLQRTTDNDQRTNLSLACAKWAAKFVITTRHGRLSIRDSPDSSLRYRHNPHVHVPQRV